MDERRSLSQSTCTKLPFGSVLVGRRVLDLDSELNGKILIEKESTPKYETTKTTKLNIYVRGGSTDDESKYDIVPTAYMQTQQ